MKEIFSPLPPCEQPREMLSPLDFCLAMSDAVTAEREQQEWKEASLEKVRDAAERDGNAGAQFELGERRRGDGNDARAAHWFLMAAEEGHAGAQKKLGDCFRDGRGVEKEATQAVFWYRKATQQGLAEHNDESLIAIAKAAPPFPCAPSTMNSNLFSFSSVFPRFKTQTSNRALGNEVWGKIGPQQVQQ
jgi:Sel1 repeat